MAGQQRRHNDLQRAAQELISTAKAAAISGYTPRHILHLIKKGELWGCRIGRNWFTTEEAVRQYKARDVRPGPKPKDRR